MANLLPENETYEFEDRTYINPNVSLDEQTSFIDKFRTAQAQNNQEINTNTYNLGTAVPSNLGGLTGGEGYWTSRYQVPQTESLAQNLRATAQAKALNDALANEQAKWKKRYNDAYNAAKIRAANPSTSDPDDDEGEDPDFESTGETVNIDENELVVPPSETTDAGPVSNANAYASVTGGGQLPVDSSTQGILIDANGNQTAFKVYRGKGIEVPGVGSFTKEGAKNYLSNWVKNGGTVSNGLGKPLSENYSLLMIGWDLN